MKNSRMERFLAANSSLLFPTVSDFLLSSSQTIQTPLLSLRSSYSHYKNNITLYSDPRHEGEALNDSSHFGKDVIISNDSVASSIKENKSEILYASRNQHISFSLDKTFTRNLKTTSQPPFERETSLESIKIPKFISSIFVVPSKENSSQYPIISNEKPQNGNDNIHFQDKNLANLSFVASSSSSVPAAVSKDTFVNHSADKIHDYSHFFTTERVFTEAVNKKHLQGQAVKPNAKFSSKLAASQISQISNSTLKSVTRTKGHHIHSFPTSSSHSKILGKGRNMRPSKSSKSYKVQHPLPQVLSFMSGSLLSLHSARRRSFVPVPSTSSPGAFFDPSSPSNISAQLGTSAYLPCKIRNLGNKTVSWIRNRDSHILTVDRYTFIADERFQAWHEENSDTWTLMVKYVQERDDGRYECQVSTEPKMSHFVYFHVVSPTVKIPGGSDIYVKVGSNVSLKCVISDALKQPDYIFWYKGNERVISTGHGAPRIFLDRISNDSSVGTLLIPHAMPKDAGMYRCVPEKLTTANVTLHVINGEHPAAMQHGTSVMTSPGSPDLLVTSLVLLIMVQETTRSALNSCLV